MKIVLQAFEPLPQPFAMTSKLNVGANPVRKPMLRLTPAVADGRLFHAWRA